MKKLFTILAVAATLVSCAKEDVVREAAREAIGFDNAFVDNATRSVFNPSYTNTETGIFTDFQVYGYVEGQPLFNEENIGVTVYKEGSVPEGVNYNGQASTNWKYNGTQYWIPSATYNFSAVAPATGWTKVDATAAGTTLSFTNDGMHDILYAQSKTITAEASDNGPVGFTFRHLLSKVKFSFLNNYNADNTTIQVRGIKVNNAFTTGNVALTATTTTWSGWATNLVLEFGAATEDNATTNVPVVFENGETLESYNELLLIPYNYDGTTNDDGTTNKLAVEFTYDILVGGEVVAEFKVEPKVVVNLEPGHAYDFKATITPGEPIEFTVLDITDWDSDLDNNGTNGDETPIQ